MYSKKEKKRDIKGWSLGLREEGKDEKVGYTEFSFNLPD